MPFFFEQLNNNIESALDISQNVIIVGDFNDDLLNDNKHYLKDVLLINSFRNIIEEPTRDFALLDPILIPSEYSVLDKGVVDLPRSISDHKATFITIPFEYPVSTSYKRLVWLYSRGNYQELRDKIETHDWTFINDAPIDDVAKKFEEAFLGLVNECIPSKLVTIHTDDKPWYDFTIRKHSRLRYLIPPTVSNVSRYELRNSNNISRIPTTTTTFSKSCIPSAINEWNNLEAPLRESETFNSFCYTLKHNSQHKVPKYFIDGKRKFSIIHARLRNHCSNLNYDLFYNHLRPDSICDCLRDEETAEHYFFKCVRYTDQRIILFRDTRDFHPLSVSTLFSFFPISGFWSGNLFLIAPFPDLCLLVPFHILRKTIEGYGFCFDFIVKGIIFYIQIINRYVAEPSLCKDSIKFSRCLEALLADLQK